MEGTLGEIRLFGGNFAPRNWAFCDGDVLAIIQFQALFSILGTIYGGDSRTTFALPDLRGRVALSAGQSTGTTFRSLGSKGGNEAIALTEQQMPAHSHSHTITSSPGSLNILVNNGSSDSTEPSGNFIGKNEAGGTNYINVSDGTTLNVDSVTGTINTTVTLGGAGASQAHENRQPLIALNYIICVVGSFPSRN